MKKGNSTSSRPGAGLGLNLLKNFCITNGGAIRICSGSAFYKLSKGVESCVQLNQAFRGTFFEMDIAPDGSNYFIRGEAK